MRLHLCGVRGSTPAPGPAFTRVGGHTSCVAIAHDAELRPRLLLDGGTGLRRVGELLGDAPFEGTPLLGHLHWDHTQGIPSSPPATARCPRRRPPPGRRGRRRACPRRADGTTVLPDRCRRPPGHWTFHALEEGRSRSRASPCSAGDPARRRAHVRVPRQRRRGDDGLRLRPRTRSPSAVRPGRLGPVPRRCARARRRRRRAAPRRPVHADRAGSRPHFGHSAVDYAVALAERCNVGRLLLHHHDPSAPTTKSTPSSSITRADAVNVAAAIEGNVIDVDRWSRSPLPDISCRRDLADRRYAERVTVAEMAAPLTCRPPLQPCVPPRRRVTAPVPADPPAGARHIAAYDGLDRRPHLLGGRHPEPADVHDELPHPLRPDTHGVPCDVQAGSGVGRGPDVRTWLRAAPIPHDSRRRRQPRSVPSTVKRDTRVSLRLAGGNS